MAPAGSMRAVLCSTSDDTAWRVTLPDCHRGKAKHSPWKTIPKIFFRVGFKFTCSVCQIEYEVTWFSGLNYEIQWTKRQD
jgi:hypothetical protein